MTLTASPFIQKYALRSTLFALLFVASCVPAVTTRAAENPDDLSIVNFRVTPAVVRVGEPFTVRITVSNLGSRTALTQGPPPGTAYEQNENWRTQDYRGVPGRVRVGVSVSGPRGRQFPYRWGLGAPLQVSDSRTVTGQIVMRRPGSYTFYAAPFVGNTRGTPATKVVYGLRVLRPDQERRDYDTRALVRPTHIAVNGELIDTPEPPLIIRGVTYVPIRFPSEALGAAVRWDQESQRVEIEDGNRRVRLQIGSLNAWVNGRLVTLYERPFVQDNRTYVPLRFVSEALGASVTWDGPTRTIRIRS